MVTSSCFCKPDTGSVSWCTPVMPCTTHTWLNASSPCCFPVHPLLLHKATAQHSPRHSLHDSLHVPNAIWPRPILEDATELQSPRCSCADRSSSSSPATHPNLPESAGPTQRRPTGAHCMKVPSPSCFSRKTFSASILWARLSCCRKPRSSSCPSIMKRPGCTSGSSSARPSLEPGRLPPTSCSTCRQWQAARSCLGTETGGQSRGGALHALQCLCKEWQS